MAGFPARGREVFRPVGMRLEFAFIAAVILLGLGQVVFALVG